MNTSDVDGVTFYPTTNGRWQVSVRTRGIDGWNIHIANTLEDAIADALGKDIDMARKPRTTKKSANEVAAKISEALKFLSVGYKSGGNAQAQHTWFTGDGWACSFDGVIAAGIPIEGIDFKAYLPTAQVTQALAHVGKDMELTVDDVSMRIVSGSYEVTIPKNPATDSLIPTPPDPVLAPLDQRFVVGLELASRVISDTAPTVRNASIFLKPTTPGAQVAYTALATNGRIVVETMITDGAMPAGLLLPKAFATALSKVAGLGIEVVGWGFSDQTFTAHMANGGFIRTQRYLEEYDQRVATRADEMLTPGMSPAPVPKGFFEAVDAVLPFGDGSVYFVAGNVCSGPDDEAENWNAHLAVDKLPDGVGVFGEWLLKFKEETNGIWFGNEADETPRMVIVGDIFRAALLGFPVSDRPKPQLEPAAQQNSTPVWQQLNQQPAFAAPNGWGDPSLSDADIPF